MFKKSVKPESIPSVWARPQMKVVFRAELMPGKNMAERTFKIREVLKNSRVILENFSGEHRETEFEPLKFDRL